MARISREKEEDINTKIEFKQTNMKRKACLYKHMVLVKLSSTFSHDLTNPSRPTK
jgi:hypothetical protein